MSILRKMVAVEAEGAIPTPEVNVTFQERCAGNLIIRHMWRKKYIRNLRLGVIPGSISRDFKPGVMDTREGQISAAKTLIAVADMVWAGFPEDREEADMWAVGKFKDGRQRSRRLSARPMDMPATSVVASIFDDMEDPSSARVILPPLANAPPSPGQKVFSVMTKSGDDVEAGVETEKAAGESAEQRAMEKGEKLPDTAVMCSQLDNHASGTLAENEELQRASSSDVSDRQENLSVSSIYDTSKSMPRDLSQGKVQEAAQSEKAADSDNLSSPRMAEIEAELMRMSATHQCDQARDTPTVKPRDSPERKMEKGVQAQKAAAAHLPTLPGSPTISSLEEQQSQLTRQCSMRRPSESMRRPSETVLEKLISSNSRVNSPTP
jgi:hypothetical protein